MPFGIPRSERKFRLSPIQGLDLRFLVHAQNQCILRRIQVQTDNCRLLGLKLRIRALAAPVMNLVRLERRTVQNSVNRCAPQTGHSSKLPSTPCVRSSKRPLTCQPNDLDLLPRRNARGTPLSGLVPETVQPFRYKALSPFETIGTVQSAAFADLFERQALCRQQDHARTPTVPLLSPMRTDPHLQRQFLLSSQLKFHRLSGHGTPP